MSVEDPTYCSGRHISSREVAQIRQALYDAKLLLEQQVADGPDRDKTVGQIIEALDLLRG